MRVADAVRSQGFTLIELSIVLVIIGLIVGGVLVGRDLVSAAAVRAQLSQLERYAQASNTFKAKYGQLPGDINNPDATNFGFKPRGQYGGEGDGNGIIQTNQFNTFAGANCGIGSIQGETAMFWVDLTMAGLIGDGLTRAQSNSWPSSSVSGSQVGLYIPSAKLAASLYMYIWSGGINGGNGINYYGLSAVTQVGNGTGFVSSPGITVKQAAALDAKIDDGLPQTGRLLAIYANGYGTPDGVVVWSGTTGTGATAGSSTTCYDNANSAGATQQYSVSQAGATPNCGLSFQFQ